MNEWRLAAEASGIERSRIRPILLPSTSTAMTISDLSPRRRGVGGLREGQSKEFRPPGWSGGSQIASLKFSPDGSKISAAAGGPEGDLWILPYPSGAPRNVGRVFFFGASWLPDSRRLVVIRPTAVQIENSQILSIDSVSRDAQVIYTSPESLGAPSVSPRWKPDRLYCPT